MTFCFDLNNLNVCLGMLGLATAFKRLDTSEGSYTQELYEASEVLIQVGPTTFALPYHYHPVSIPHPNLTHYHPVSILFLYLILTSTVND